MSKGRPLPTHENTSRQFEIDIHLLATAAEQIGHGKRRAASRRATRIPASLIRRVFGGARQGSRPCPLWILLLASARSNQAARSTSGNWRTWPERGGHSSGNELLRIVAGWMSATIAQTWTPLPAICRTETIRMAGPAKVSPVSSKNSRCAPFRKLSSGSTSPLATDQAWVSLSPRTGRPDERGRSPAVLRAGGKEANLCSSSSLKHQDLRPPKTPPAPSGRSARGNRTPNPKGCAFHIV